MKKPSALQVVIMVLAVCVIAVGTTVIIHNQNELDCVASQAPAAPTYNSAPDPTTGLVAKDPSKMVKPPAGVFPMGVAIDDYTLKDFFQSCHTQYTIKQQTVYIAQNKYNYVLEQAGLNVNYKYGVQLTDDAAQSLGLPIEDDSDPELPMPIEYVLAPTK